MSFLLQQVNFNPRYEAMFSSWRLRTFPDPQGNKEYWECLFCGIMLRNIHGYAGYNFAHLEECPYCVAYAGQDCLPTWVLNYRDRRLKDVR